MSNVPIVAPPYQPAPIPQFQYALRPWSNGTPFTYQDHRTYTNLLEALIAHVDDVTKHVNGEMATFYASLSDELSSLKQQLVTDFSDQNTWVTNELVTLIQAVNDKLDSYVVPENVALKSDVYDKETADKRFLRSIPVATVATLNAGPYTIPSNADVLFLTLNGSITVTMPNVAVGQGFWLFIIQGTDGSRTIAWPAGVTFPALGSAPMLGVLTGTVNSIQFVRHPTGWYGFVVL